PHASSSAPSHGATGASARAAPYAPDAYAAVTWDVPLGPGSALRFESGVSVDPSVAFAVGPVWGRRRPQPAPPVVEAVVVEAPPAELAVDPPEARVWVPHPVCAWMTPAEASPWLAGLDGGLARVEAPGFVPAFVDRPGVVALAPAPVQGSLIVVGHPGDQVRVDQVELPPSPDGAWVVAHAEGPVTVQVAGGGRSESVEVGVSSGFATWVRAAEPAPTQIRFASGSAEVQPGDRAALAALAASLGGWALELRGSASPEGDAARNTSLAAQRADGVRGLLVDAGVDPARIRIAAGEVGAEGAAPETQRRVSVTPVEAK
ncbi:MAG: OmpA family protein, partial [Myxococcota bacterium]